MKALGRFVGRKSSAALVQEARKASNAATVRVIPPGAAVTQDLRRDRLNIYLDAAGRMTSLRCW